jgi:hypothetical protein
MVDLGLVLARFLHFAARSGLRRKNAPGRLWPNCVNGRRGSAYFLSRIAQLACGDALRSVNERFRKFDTWVIGDGEHEPALGSYRAMVP